MIHIINGHVLMILLFIGLVSWSMLLIFISVRDYRRNRQFEKDKERRGIDVEYVNRSSKSRRNERRH